MSVSGLRFANLRSFREDTAFEVRPVTLVYGPNNVGKSALIRVLPLLADSLGPGRDALDFDNRLREADLDFERLRWRGSRAESGEDITLGVDLGDGSRVTWAIRLLPDWPRTIVAELELRHGVESVSAEWKLRRGEERDPELTYLVNGGEGRHRFEGLLPPLTLVPESLRPLRAELEALREGVIWLGSVRPSPGRRTPTRGAPRWSLEPSGRDAPVVLAQEAAVRDEVVAWYREALGLVLDVRTASATEVEVAVQRAGAGAPRVDLLDCGEGPGQVLPVVTALAMVKHHAARRGPAILCVEEPESHLHPAAQQALADFLCECASVEGVRVVFETHSPYLLYAVHLRVMKGFPSEKVAVHWVRQDEAGVSSTDLVELKPDGSVEGPLPPGAFDTELELLAAIERLRQGPR